MLFLIEKDNTIYGVYNNYNIMVENMKYLKIENFKILKFNINMVSYDIVKNFRNNNSNNNKIFILKNNVDYIGLYDSLEKANDETFIGILVEGKDGLRNLFEICNIEQLDMIYLGIYDIAQSLNLSGDITNPKCIKGF